MNYTHLSIRMASLFIFKNMKNFATVEAMANMLAATGETGEAFCKAYSNYYNRCLKKSLQQSLLQAIHYDDNIVTKYIKENGYSTLPQPMIEGVDFDLKTIKDICNIDSNQLLVAMAKRFDQLGDVILSLPKLPQSQSIGIDNYSQLLDFYKENGYGYFAKGSAYYYENSLPHLAPNRDMVTLKELKGYEKQQNIIINNTLSFINGGTYNNILLYGDKGTGKSSTVKAIVNEYAHLGLKIIEIKLGQIDNLPKLYGYIASSPFKFIVLLDDISFSEMDNTYSALKAFIEGGVNAKPDNMVIYATSNRKNMVVERFTDRDGDEVRVTDAIQSASSLSDRFGIEVTFFNMDKTQYLVIVKDLAVEAEIELEDYELYLQAERFATYKSGRSPRTARQFIADLKSKETAIQPGIGK